MDMKACDKMILAIIQDDSYQDVISELKKQSVTIMIGLNHEDLEKALKILKSHGKRTVMQQQVLFTGGTPQPLAATVPIPVRCGGVVLFVLDVDRYERY